MEPRLNNDFL